ncbi:tyrosine-type recombinase/integrase [Vallitalea guaymasensis]|uniref:tyrosine-type recombinase/integrase n=1 Tax=Vallitalea guaymasensis TaxID=1185412 RepID=UPI0023521AA1|nr:tyrosine-type recombinase/integrase [Vallitalea guaymasensis]
MILESNQKLLDQYRFICRSKGLTNKSINSTCNYDLRLYLEWLGEKNVLEVSHIDIQSFLMYCAIERGNGDRALNRKHTNLNMFYKRLIIQLDLSIKNPVDKVDKPKIRKKLKPHLKEYEYRQMVKFLEAERNLRGLALISLLYSSGCRLSEIHQLNRNSLNHKVRRFVVVGKGEKERECLFSPDASMRIKVYLATRTDDNEALFTTLDGKRRLSEKGIQDYLKRLGKRAGVEQNVHPHLFRHGRAMQLLKKGVALEIIQMVLGHENIATTQIYAQMNFDSVQDKVDAIDNIIYLDKVRDKREQEVLADIA